MRSVAPPPGYIEAEKRRQLAEIERRRQQYVGDRPPLPVDGRIVIVVDDGIATGGTVKAALRGLGRHHPARLVLAVPVAPADTLRELAAECDDIVCPATSAQCKESAVRIARAAVIGNASANVSTISTPFRASGPPAAGDRSVASGMVTTAQQVGGALGLAVLVSVATGRTTSLLGSGHSPAVAQLAGSHLAFGVGAGLLAVGAVLAALLLGRATPAAVPEPTAVSEATYEPEPEPVAS